MLYVTLKLDKFLLGLIGLYACCFITADVFCGLVFGERFI